MFKEILALVSLFLTSEIFAQNLEAILSDTRLPVPVSGMPVVYDGEDSIYVLGGRESTNNNQKDILKFSVTTQTLEKVGTMDPVAIGSAVWTGNGNILYFGGHNGSRYQTNVWSYKPDGASDWTEVGFLPRGASHTSSVWDQGEYSYVFGGYDGTVPYLNTISRYSTVNNAFVVVGELPGPRVGTTAVWDETTGDAYVFGGYASDGGLNDILKFNPAEDNVVKLNVTLPKAADYSCAVWTGREAYIIGGLTSSGQLTSSSFNPSTNQVLNVPVNNLPSNLNLHGCAFVSKLNRIYVFGGRVSGSPRDEILYIDLGPIPTTPTTTTPMTTTKEPGNPTDCKNEVCGTRFADPYCCRSFYQCENKEAVLRHCPSQLHFNPSHGECDVPEIVKCGSVDA